MGQVVCCLLKCCMPVVSGNFVPFLNFQKLDLRDCLPYLFPPPPGEQKLWISSPVLQEWHPVRSCMDLSWCWGAIASNLKSRRKIPLRSIIFLKKAATCNSWLALCILRTRFDHTATTHLENVGWAKSQPKENTLHCFAQFPAQAGSELWMHKWKRHDVCSGNMWCRRLENLTASVGLGNLAFVRCLSARCCVVAV